LFSLLLSVDGWPHEAEVCLEEEGVDEYFSLIVAYRRTKAAKQTIQGMQQDDEVQYNN
jgi:hypothetical protein